MFDLPVLEQAFKSDPYLFYAGIRRAESPLVRVRLPTGVEAWLVTTYAACWALLHDQRLCKTLKPTAARPESSSYNCSLGTAHPIFKHLLMTDPPEHTRLRALIRRQLSPEKIRALRSQIAGTVEALLDRMSARGRADLIADFAIPLPLITICRMVGIPQGDEAIVQKWSAALLEADLNAPGEVPHIANDIDAYFLRLAEEKRRTPDRSAFCALASARDEGELTDEELTAMGFVFVSAGFETTANFIGNGCLALLCDRTQWEVLLAEPDSLPSAIEELLRFDGPLEIATLRYANADIEIEDTTIRAGDLVFIGLGAANRDPSRFSDPDQLNVKATRATRHLAFGHGVHYCVGAALARLQGKLAFAGLLRRFPDLELDAERAGMTWTPGLIMRGVKSLPVRFSPR